MGEISALRADDLKELDNISDFATENTKEVQELADDFARPSDFTLFLDSKVPEKHKSIFNFFNPTPSNRDDIVKQIETYKTFFKRLNDVIEKTKIERDTDCVDHYNDITNLIEELSKLEKEAKLGENSTSSSAIYKLHKLFLQGNEKLKGMIKSVELIIVTEGWKKSTQAIKTLREDMERWTKDIFEKFSAEKRELLEKNKQMQEQQEKLLEENKRMQKTSEEILRKNKKMQETQEAFMKSNRKIQKNQEKLIESFEQMKKEHQKTLLEKEKKMEEQQETLIKSIEQMKKEYQETLSKNKAEIKQEP